MSRPSSKKLSDWYAAQPDGDKTCTDCGKVGPSCYVQPQHPYYAKGREGVALCTDCINANIARAKQARKAELAAEPRCEVDGCKARGTWEVAGNVLLCGRHKKKAQDEAARSAAASGMGWLAMFGGVSYTREGVLEMAEGKQKEGAV